MASLNDATTDDNYTDDNTLKCEGARSFSLQVVNAAIYLQRTSPAGGGVRNPSNWGEEEYYLPGYFNPPVSPVEAIRVRSAIAGSPARVTIHAT